MCVLVKVSETFAFLMPLNNKIAVFLFRVITLLMLIEKMPFVSVDQSKSFAVIIVRVNISKHCIFNTKSLDIRPTDPVFGHISYLVSVRIIGNGLDIRLI